MKTEEYPAAEFNLSYWLGGENYAEIPGRPDAYRRGHLTMGKDVDRGLAIQRARGQKQDRTNLAFFAAHILPRLTGEALRSASLDYGHQTKDFAPAIAAGWQKWRKGDATSWIHSTDAEKLARAAALGAGREF